MIIFNLVQLICRLSNILLNTCTSALNLVCTLLSSLVNTAAAAAVDGPRVSHGYSVTPLQLFEWFILEHALHSLSKQIK